MNNSLISNLEDFPSEEKDPEFWATLTSPHFQKSVGFLLLNETRKYQPEILTDDACRSHLAKIKALQELYDLPNALIKAGEKDDGPTDELPE